MKIDEEEKVDRFGITPCCRISGKDANYEKIFDYLYRNYNGYKFAVIFDCTKDEYEEPEKKTPVYFLDELIEEMVDYAGVDRVRSELDKRYK